MSSYELKNQIVKHYAGSLAYGTNLPDSDVDIRGIFCADRREISTPFFPVNEVTLQDEEDGKMYELSKFMQLYLDCNPNIVETLWIDEEDIILSSSMYRYLRFFNERLLSSKAAFTFSGYALSQLKRIKGHNKWINNPQPKEPPKHIKFVKLVQNFLPQKILARDFNLSEFYGYSCYTMVHYGSDIFGIVEDGSGHKILDKHGDFNISIKQKDSNLERSAKPILIFKYMADEYERAKRNHTEYWQWKNNRNTKRSELEEKFGYDTKHAMHLVRLLRMGEEILTGQGVIVKRPDAKELLDIRAGEWQYDDLVAYAESKDKLIREVLYKTTSLPKKPDVHLAAQVLMDCQDAYWQNGEQ